MKGGFNMKKFISLFALFFIFLGSLPVSAATIYSAKPYKPSTKYVYSIYDAYAYDKHVTIKCKKFDSDYLHCSSKDGFYSYRVTKDVFALNAGGDSPVAPPYIFPLTKGKTYHKTGYSGMNSFEYSYKVIETNTKRKVGKKTYSNVIKILNYYDGGYTFIAKNYGIILITTNEQGYQVPIYKLKNYHK